MENSHFLALLPLMILLIFSLIWYGKGLLHLMTFGYTMVLAIIAITGGWELFFWPICAGTGIITILLFIFAMTKGGWL